MALRLGHGEWDGEHLLSVLVGGAGGIIPILLGRMGVPADGLSAQLQRVLDKRPRVSGPGAQTRPTRRLQELMTRAEGEAQALRDEYVSAEHIGLALLEEGARTEAGRLLAEAGVDRERFLHTLNQMRGAQRVTSDTPESSYDALEKYGLDLACSSPQWSAGPRYWSGWRDSPRRAHSLAQDKKQSSAHW